MVYMFTLRSLLFSDSGTGADKVPATCSGVGVSSLMGHAPSPMEVTCILCQEETKDFSSQERTFVQAVHVQRSCVLRKCPPVDTNRGNNAEAGWILSGRVGMRLDGS